MTPAPGPRDGTAGTEPAVTASGWGQEAPRELTVDELFLSLTLGQGLPPQELVPGPLSVWGCRGGAGDVTGGPHSGDGAAAMFWAAKPGPWTPFPSLAGGRLRPRGCWGEQLFLQGPHPSPASPPCARPPVSALQ